MGQKQLIYRGPEWDFELLRRAHDAIEEIALDDLGLDVYRNQIEVITSESNATTIVTSDNRVAAELLRAIRPGTARIRGNKSRTAKPCPRGRGGAGYG